MPTCNLQYAADKGRLSFSTSTGFSLVHGDCGISTASGELRPLPSCAANKGVKHELHVRRISGNAVEFWQTIRNLRSEPLDITEIRMFDGELQLGGAGWRMAHPELYKCERYFEGYGLYTDGMFAPVPGVEGEFGLSEDWPFPGVFFTHPERGTVLMATLSQERCKPHWSLRRSRQGTLITATDCFTGVPSVRVKEGQELATECWVMIFTQGGLEEALEQYYRLLRKRISFYGEKSVLRRAVLWGTWNYNCRPHSYCDITHDMVAANARALAKLVPDKPHFVMIDDGYQRGRSQEHDKGMEHWFSSCLEIFHDDGTPPHDPKLFPHGMKGIADAIRKAGSRPALWTTIRIHKKSALAKAHPEWLLQVEGHAGFHIRSAYLDYSIPEVREYTHNAWRTIFQEWGYEGMKLDFWSLPFEIPQVRYRNKDRTAVELRNLFLKDLREFVPKSGFLLVAVVTNAGGNPFVGRYADAARMGMDIGSGSFAEAHHSATCLTESSSFYRHDCLLGDPDSFGWCPKNTPGENRLWATMALFSGPICEIGGDLTNPTAEARQLLQTGVRFFKPSRRTLNGLSSGSIANLPSSHLVLERDDGVYEAYLNWRSAQRIIRLPHPVRDLWTGTRISSCEYKIPPHDVICFKSERKSHS